MKVAAASFVVAKMMFIGTAVCMMISDMATIISMSLYSFLVVLAIILSLWEGFTRKKKTYAQLEAEIAQLQKLLKTEQSA